jgi:hypothetical protein
VASAKLAYCDRTMALLRDHDPVVTHVELEEDVADIEYSLGHYYRDESIGLGDVPPGLDGAIRAIFEDLGGPRDGVTREPLAPASALIRRLEPDLLTNVFRWTGHFPERTRVLVRYLAERAEHLRQGYVPAREHAATVAVTTLVTGLAMNHVQRGSYLP